ncbi:MAG: hypothetical protein IJ325_03150 [Clostridia bacterium]|nr:hypothetical protein [Clostridia bacterium]
MDKKNLKSLHSSLAGNDVNTASALREMLADLDAQNESKTEGVRSARGRITMLFDEGTFVETGAYVSKRNSEFDADTKDAFEGVICGWGAVNGSLVYAFSQDVGRTKGAVSEMQAKKIAEIYRLACENGAPVVGIFDSVGAYLPEGVRALAAYGQIMRSASQASGVVPQIAVVPGISQGAAAVIAGMYDFVIVTENTSSISVNPPFVVGEDAGKSKFASESGLAALCAKNDDEAMAMARDLLGLLPANNAEGTVETVANDEINRLVSIDSYNATRQAKDLVAAFADNGEMLELWKDYAPEAITGIIKLGGIVCGVVGNNHAVNDGIITADAARKMAKMISFCDSFHIPVITLVDSMGLDVSKEAEASPYAAELAKLAHLYAMTRTPVITLIAGEAYGTVVSLMGSKALGADIVLALESAKIGVMNAASAVAFLWNDKIGGEVTREDLEAEWDAVVGTPVAAARAGEVDDIILSAEIRQRIAAAVMMLQSKSKAAPVRRHAVMPL